MIKQSIYEAVDNSYHDIKNRKKQRELQEKGPSCPVYNSVDNFKEMQDTTRRCEYCHAMECTCSLESFLEASD